MCHSVRKEDPGTGSVKASLMREERERGRMIIERDESGSRKNESGGFCGAHLG